MPGIAFRILATLAASALLAACGTVTWVSDVDSTDDGKMVVVTGAQFQMGLGPPVAEKPIRWICTRDDGGTLSCVYDTANLPQLQ